MSLGRYLLGILRISAFLLLLQVVFRGIFATFFVESSLLSQGDFWRAFFLGIRFDGTIVAYINSIPLLLVFLVYAAVGKVPSFFLKFSRFYYLVFAVLVFFLNVMDLGFYSFFQDRLNVMIFGFFEDDTVALIKTIWSDYPVIWGALAFVAFIVSSKAFLKYAFKEKVVKYFGLEPQQSLSSRAFVLLGLFVLMLANGVAARGSLTLFPLSEMDLGVTSNPVLNDMAFNSSRAFSRSVELRSQIESTPDLNIRKFGYDGKVNQAFANYFDVEVGSVPENPFELMRHQIPTKVQSGPSPHVVLVVMESWGQYWLQYQSGDFDLVGAMKTHLSEDYLTRHCLPGTGGTIGSLSALMAGQIHRLGYNFLSETQFLHVPFQTSPARIFQKAGYETRLVYGGNPGWRELAKFARAQGYALVDGGQEVQASLGTEIEEHSWGVYDEEVFAHVLKVLKEASQPQFIVVMTTTNHPPFELPTKYQLPELKIPSEVQAELNTSVELSQKRFDTYRYSMDRLAEFMTAIKAGDLGKNTLVAGTGDHNFWNVRFNDKNLIDQHGVPFYLYVPQGLKSETAPAKEAFSNIYMSHQDILPTLYELALSGQDYFSLGKNVLKVNPEDSYAFDGFGLALSADGFMSSSQGVHAYQENDLATSRLERMKMKYQSLQAIMDDYFRFEKSRTSN